METVARHGLKVGTVMLDRGFYSTDVFSLLQESGHRWLMPCPNSLHVKEALAEYGAGRRAKVSKCVITQSSKNECEYDIVAAPREAKRKKKDGEELEPWEKYIAFATNDPEIDVTEYAERWGIETGYRQAEDARAKTRSKSHGPRVMCWAMTLMLFNAWVFVDAMRRLECAAYCTRHAIPLHSALSAIETDMLGLRAARMTHAAPGQRAPDGAPARACAAFRACARSTARTGDAGAQYRRRRAGLGARQAGRPVSGAFAIGNFRPILRTFGLTALRQLRTAAGSRPTPRVA